MVKMVVSVLHLGANAEPYHATRSLTAGVFTCLSAWLSEMRCFHSGFIHFCKLHAPHGPAGISGDAVHVHIYLAEMPPPHVSHPETPKAPF